jgi:hypothetical protein
MIRRLYFVARSLDSLQISSQSTNYDLLSTKPEAHHG